MSRRDVTDIDVCLAYKEYRESVDKGIRFPWPYEILSRKLGQPEKVCYRAMERANNRGYIEYGVSLRSGWLSDLGEKLLRDYEETI